MSYLLSQVIESTLQLVFLRLIHVEQLSFISVSISERAQKKTFAETGHVFRGRKEVCWRNDLSITFKPIPLFTESCAIQQQLMAFYLTIQGALLQWMCCSAVCHENHLHVLLTPEPNRVVSQAHSSKPHQSLTKPPESSHVQTTQLFTAFLITRTQLNYY